MYVAMKSEHHFSNWEVSQNLARELPLFMCPNHTPAPHAAPCFPWGANLSMRRQGRICSSHQQGVDNPGVSYLFFSVTMFP